MLKIIKKYLVYEKYIKINCKPILYITNPLIFQNLNKFLLILRKKARENGIGDIFIISLLCNISNISINWFDAFYDFEEIELKEEKLSIQSNLYYSGLLYKNILLNKINNNFTIYRSSIIKINNISNNNNIFEGYSPEKYYLLNKIIIDWIKINKDQNKFIFLNAWNNYQEGNYLEPDEIYGYSTINSFSKALFNISFKEYVYNFAYLNNKCIVGIQAHIFYEDLINEIINKTNNIPIKFDLFITTISFLKKNIIEKYIKAYSLANKYEIKIVENKGRDILPFIIQMKNKVKKYKYFCHVHTKKSKHDVILGNNWRNYLYENLLGNKQIISEILNDFETFEKLGFIFPEFYYYIIKDIKEFTNIDFGLNRKNKKYMNFILNQIYPGFEIGDNIIFPSGNMFWAKISAIYQIFKIRFKKKFPKELNQTNETIMHAIERIWLYLVKLNGFYYKIIFKHY